MCGRYSLTSPPEVITARFNLQWSQDIPARYNIAPSQKIPAIRSTESGNELVFLKWGLIPSWNKDPNAGVKPINARAETLASNALFRNAYRRHHCLIPADAFYEWKAMGERKQPYCIRMADDTLFGIAGLWELWTSPTGEAIETCTLITTNANELMGELHSRMPVIIQPNDYSVWLNSSNQKAQELLKPFPSDLMRYYPVSTRVNNVRNDDADCQKPYEGIVTG